MITVDWVSRAWLNPSFFSISKRDRILQDRISNRSDPFVSPVLTIEWDSWLTGVTSDTKMNDSFPRTPKICFLHLLSFLFLFLTRKDTNTSPCFLSLILGGHVKKERKKVKPGSSYSILQLPKKKVSLFCVCHQTSLVLRFIVPSFASFLRRDLGWPARALRPRSGGRHERGRTTASTGVEDAGERTCHGMPVQCLFCQGTRMGVPRPQCSPWYLYSWCWFLGRL